MGDDEPSTGDTRTVVSARIAPADVARLDQIATRRGIERGEVIADAVDEFLAREAWSGRFIPPPPPMRLPRSYRGRGRRRRQSRRSRR